MASWSPRPSPKQLEMKLHILRIWRVKLGLWCLPVCVRLLCWSQWACVWFLPSPLSCWRSPGKLLNLSEHELFICKVAIIMVSASLTAWVQAKSFQSCLTLYDHVDCSPPGSSVHGILQARILERIAMACSRGSSRPRDGTHASYGTCIGRQILYG